MSEINNLCKTNEYNEKIISLYRDFNGKNLSLLDSFYSSKVKFSDPSVEIEGLSLLKKYYAHVYAPVNEIHFDFSEILHEGHCYTASWLMRISVKGLNGGRPYNVRGLSRLNFNQEGLIEVHRDYLDLGEMIYEKLPLQGAVIRFLKKYLNNQWKKQESV